MFQLLDQYRVAQLHVCDDADADLKAIIAIHNTRFGPALGGCRFVHYNDPDDALRDAVRLAQGMSYKAVMAGIPQGGGKAVILKPKGGFDRDKLFRAFGRFVQSLNGQYITAIDAGTTHREMDLIAQETPHVTSTTAEGNPSECTARGVFEGIQAAVRCKLHRDNLKEVRVAIQGLGNVGMRLASLLHEAGARLIVADVDRDKADKARAMFDAKVVAPDDILREPCAVFAPCGLGGIINDRSVEHLGCRILAGPANNQLAERRHGQILHERGILYAPDYVINAGGLIYASLNHHKAPAAEIDAKIHRIALTLEEIFQQAEREHRATSEVADRLAEARLYGSLSAAA